MQWWRWLSLRAAFPPHHLPMEAFRTQCRLRMPVGRNGSGRASHPARSVQFPVPADLRRGSLTTSARAARSALSASTLPLRRLGRPPTLPAAGVLAGATSVPGEPVTALAVVLALRTRRLRGVLWRFVVFALRQPVREQKPRTWRTNMKPADKAKQLAAEALDKLRTALEAGHSDTLAAHLRAMARFHDYSFGNIMLITTSDPTRPASPGTAPGRISAGRSARARRASSSSPPWSCGAIATQTTMTKASKRHPLPRHTRVRHIPDRRRAAARIDQRCGRSRALRRSPCGTDSRRGHRAHAGLRRRAWQRRGRLARRDHPPATRLGSRTSLRRPCPRIRA